MFGRVPERVSASPHVLQSNTSPSATAVIGTMTANTAEIDVIQASVVVAKSVLADNTVFDVEHDLVHLLQFYFNQLTNGSLPFYYAPVFRAIEPLAAAELMFPFTIKRINVQVNFENNKAIILDAGTLVIKMTKPEHIELNPTVLPGTSTPAVIGDIPPNTFVPNIFVEYTLDTPIPPFTPWFFQYQFLNAASSPSTLIQMQIYAAIQ